MLLIGLIIEYQDVLYKIAKTRLNCEDDICDVVQNTFISAYQSIKTLKNKKYFKTWLVKILINKCNDFYLRNKRDNISLNILDENTEIHFEDFTNDYGIDYLNNRQTHFDPIPDTWIKMRDILLFWASKQIDGFRCDMAEMVPTAFCAYLLPIAKAPYRRIKLLRTGKTLRK